MFLTETWVNTDGPATQKKGGISNLPLSITWFQTHNVMNTKIIPLR